MVISGLYPSEEKDGDHDVADAAVAVKLDSVMFSWLQVEVKLEPCSVVFMVLPWAGKRVETNETVKQN